MNPTDREPENREAKQSDRPDLAGDSGPDTVAGGEAYATRAFLARDGQAAEPGRFTILRPHAQGGLGRVTIARDRQLNREIALKEILPDHADDSVSRQRFVREAEITGALEHPGVVPVYSLGEFPDGRPFYAMRFILGRDLRQSIEEYHRQTGKRVGADFTSRQLLGQFVDACQAVEYAHNRGVVHRDIKPQNIMLGDYGETLVVDWGLARTCDETIVEPSKAPSTLRRVTPSPRSSPSHTRDGQVVGTPAYMSPEQASGRLDLLGPANDIYSLGATLYQVLTGRAPFAASLDDVLAQVQRGQYQKPRELNSEIPRPLEAICLRAMALRPADRYASARDLALDVQRYLADERVAAYDEPLWTGLWRWIRNHRTAVFSLMTAGTVALAALTAGIVLLGAANRRERQAKDLATSHYEETLKQRKRAEQNFQMAQDAVQQYYVRVSEETLLSQPGMQPLRNALLQDALGYYERFLKQRVGDPALREELAQAAYYVGRITETISSPELALPYYQQSLAQYEKLGKASNKEQAEIARVLNAMGGAHQKLNQIVEARSYYKQARKLREQLAAGDSSDVEAARELSNTVMNLGSLAMVEGNSQNGLSLMQHAQTLRLAHAFGEEVQLKLQQDLAMGYFNLAAAQLSSGKSEGAQHNFLEAEQAFAALVEREPAVLLFQRRLAFTRRMLGDLRGHAGDNGQAIAYYQQSREALQQLARQNPSVPEFSADLAGVLMNLGAQQSQLGDLPEGLSQFEHASQLLRKLVEAENATPRYRRDLGAVRRAHGQLLIQLDRLEEARQEFAASRELLQALVREFPGNQDYATQLQQTLNALEKVKE